jgi:hypothetical protein
MDRGVDPYGLSTDDDAAALESRILMAVDKYQAAVARGRKIHSEAIDLVKRILSPKYGTDVMMTRVLQVLDAVGEDEMSFAEAA